MKKLIIPLLVLFTTTHLSASGPAWSREVDGVRARFSLERQKDSPFLKVFLEFQNTSDVAGIKLIRFSPEKLKAQIVDGNGIELHYAIGVYDGVSPLWTPLGLPMEGTLRFRISFPGLGYRPAIDRTIIDLGPSNAWVVPDVGTHFLSGEIDIQKEEGDHPHSDWSGTLVLPKVEIHKK